MRWRLAAALLVAGMVPDRALADDVACRKTETTFKPAPNLQIAVWIEDDTGKYVDTIYVTRLTGTLGLANRPGNGFFKSDFRFPYGRREMVLPVWAHKRDKRYGRVTMGGKYGNSMATCDAAGISASECDDETIGYHFMVSSPEPFFCSPRGGVKTKVNGVDTMTCASSFYGSKGAYGASPLYSLYPPRADLTSFVDEHDGTEAKQFATVNDLGAVSGATPTGDKAIDPLQWIAPQAGSYVLKIETHLEADTNAFHNYPSIDDGSPELNGYGRNFLGQPSIVYAVPFTVGAGGMDFGTTTYEGYSDWDGATGTLHPGDMTISTGDGTGAGRLLPMSDASGMRVRVRTFSTCGGGQTDDGGTDSPDGGDPVCQAPAAPTAMALTAGPSSIAVSFVTPSAGAAVEKFEVRYRSGTPITAADFLDAIPAESPSVAAPGSSVATMITGLRSETQYHVAARALSACGAASPVITTAATTGQAKFVTLEGCFVATAAYGSDLGAELDMLRRFRDRHLQTNAAGQLFVASYYSLGPALARVIARDERVRATAREALRPLVAVARALR